MSVIKGLVGNSKVVNTCILAVLFGLLFDYSYYVIQGNLLEIVLESFDSETSGQRLATLRDYSGYMRGLAVFCLFVVPFVLIVGGSKKAKSWLSRWGVFRHLGGYATFAANTVNRAKRAPAIVYIMLLAFLFLPLKGVTLTSDSAWYLNNALNIADGLGYVDEFSEPVFHRGIMFPGMIAVVFKIFGPSVQNAFLLVRIFYLLNILVVYLLGKKLYDERVGVLTSLLLFTSFVYNLCSSQLLLDIVFPFFVLLFIYFSFNALVRQKLTYSIMAGITLGLSLLMKEMAVIFVPLPMLAGLLIKEFRSVRSVKHIAVCLGTMILSIVPWVSYVIHSTGEVGVLLGVSGPKVLRTMPGLNAESVGGSFWSIGDYILPFIHYYKRYMSAQFGLSFFLLLAWGYFGFRTVQRRNKNDVFLMLCAMLFVPIIYFQGVNGWRVGQSIYFYFITYIVFSATAISIFDRVMIGRTPRLREDSKASVGAIFVVIIVLSQIVVEKKMPAMWLGLSNRGGSYFSANTFNVYGWHNDQVKQAAEWFNNSVEVGEGILCDWFWASSLDFYLDKRFKIFQLPYRVFPRYLASGRQKGIEAAYPAPPLFLWVHKNEIYTNSYLRAFCERDLLRYVQSEGIKYVVITYRRLFLTEYFDDNTCFEKVLNLPRIKIYEVRPCKERKGFEMAYGSELFTFLNGLKNENPKKLMYIQKEFFENVLALEPSDLESMGDGKRHIFMLRNRKQKLESAVKKCIQAIESFPEEVHYRLVLGGFYRNLCQFDKSLRVYEDVMQIQPNNADAHGLAGELYLETGRESKAEREFLKALSINPNNDAISSRLALQYGKAGKYEKAIDLYEGIYERNITKLTDVDEFFKAAREGGMLGSALGRLASAKMRAVWTVVSSGALLDFVRDHLGLSEGLQREFRAHISKNEIFEAFIGIPRRRVYSKIDAVMFGDLFENRGGMKYYANVGNFSNHYSFSYHLRASGRLEEAKIESEIASILSKDRAKTVE